MEKTSNVTDLVAIEDAALDEVAGGCRWGGGRGQWGQWMSRWASDIDLNVQINVVNVVGNTLVAGDDLTVNVDASNDN